MPLRRIALLFLFSAFVIFLQPALAAQTPFSIDDYFKLNRITELALSSDGEMMAYAVESKSLEENKTIRIIHVSKAALGAKPIVIDKIQDAKNLAWTPESPNIAYLAPDDAGIDQVFAYNVETHRIRRLTHAPDSVVQFKIAPNGKRLAYLTRQRSQIEETLYQKFRTKNHGIRIDTDQIGHRHFVDPIWDIRVREATLWVARFDDKAIHVPVPGYSGYVESAFSWSYDSRRLSVVYADTRTPNDLLEGIFRSSLGVFDVHSQEFMVAFRAGDGFSYEGGEWVDAKNLLVRRRQHKRDHLWIAALFPDIAIVDVDIPIEVEGIKWGAIEIGGRGAAFHISPGRRILLETVDKGESSLFELDATGEKRTSSIIAGINGSNKLLRFSHDFSVAAFVNESLATPPEVYVWMQDEEPTQITNLNDEIKQRIGYTMREVVWQSEDDITVRGWLLEPKHKNGTASPLLTFVHAGPVGPFKNMFASSFRLWPYPFEVLAESGVAVFFPNYRGTGSYGRSFSWPESVGTEPVADIIAGINHLVSIGAADPSRLGIAGHSHGAFIGPLTMVSHRNFVVGSFAEYPSNSVVKYELIDGWLNREVTDPIWGKGQSLYEAPQRYIELSPNLHFQDLTAATLFEAGAYASAIMMTGYPKAARYFKVPTEYIIYPKTGHNPHIPNIQKESATRNLDWFRFWLLKEEDPAPSKIEQYVRWRAMREEQCERLNGDDTPWYCENDEVNVAAQ